MGAIESMRRWRCRLVVLATVAFVLANILAYRHAGAFFIYTGNGVRTPPPESLTWPDRLRLLVRGIQVPKPVSHTTPAAWMLAYENVMVPGRDGLTLSGWVIPSARTNIVAVVFHGYSSEKSGMLHEAAALHDLGYTVVLVDFPGHGGSPGFQTTLGWDEARDVAAVVEWVTTTWPEHRVLAYGHSMGGVAVLRAMAVYGTRLDAAIVESVFDSLPEAIRERFRLMRVPPFPGAEVLLFWGSVRLGINGFAHDAVAYARAVEVPTLVSHGRDDNRAPWQRAQSVYAALAGPKHWLLVDGAGHVQVCLAAPEAWATEVASLLGDPRKP